MTWGENKGERKMKKLIVTMMLFSVGCSPFSQPQIEKAIIKEVYDCNEDICGAILHDGRHVEAERPIKEGSIVCALKYRDGHYSWWKIDRCEGYQEVTK
jgi:hypothetical protein